MQAFRFLNAADPMRALDPFAEYPVAFEGEPKASRTHAFARRRAVCGCRSIPPIGMDKGLDASRRAVFGERNGGTLPFDLV